MGTVVSSWLKRGKIKKDCSICGRPILLGEKYLSVAKEPTPNRHRINRSICQKCYRTGIESEIFPEEFDWTLDLETNTWVNKDGRTETYSEEELEE